MSVFDKRGMWTISTSNYANYLQCMTPQNDVEEDKFIDARGSPTLDSLRLCDLHSTEIVVLDYEMFKQCIESTRLIARISEFTNTQDPQNWITGIIGGSKIYLRSNTPVEVVLRISKGLLYFPYARMFPHIIVNLNELRERASASV